MPRHTLLRVRHAGEHSRVTFVELFFDLVFVFAITQLSHGLLERFTPLGALQTGLLLYAVWTAWIYTSWSTNWLDPDRLAVRMLLFALMAAGLIVSASIPEAFGTRGLAFAAALVLIQVGRTAFIVFAVSDDPMLHRNFQRILVWLCASGLFWLAGGLAPDGVRLGLWLVAAAIDFMGPIRMFEVPGLGRSTTADWNIDGTHMAERCGLFIIIALGESIIVTGATFAALEWTTPVIAGFAAAFLASVAMWWIYFSASAEPGSRIMAETADPGRIARSAYTYMHIPIVAGLIVTAAGDELVLAHATGHTAPEAAVAVIGGPALFFAGIFLFKAALGRPFSVPLLIAIFAALAAMVPLAPTVEPFVLSGLSTLLLVIVCLTDAWLHRRTATDAEPQEGHA